MVKKQKPPWGGARRGSGRKRKTATLVPVTVKLKPDDLAWIRLFADVNDATMGELLGALVECVCSHPEMLERVRKRLHSEAEATSVPKDKPPLHMGPS